MKYAIHWPALTKIAFPKLVYLNFVGEIEDWWHPKTQESFKEKAQCIIDQYGNFTDTQVGLNLNGINNQGENIADNGGVKEAYKAYCEYFLMNSFNINNLRWPTRVPCKMTDFCGWPIEYDRPPYNI